LSGGAEEHAPARWRLGFEDDARTRENYAALSRKNSRMAAVLLSSPNRFLSPLARDTS
jgi:hypothetical protein